MGLSEKDISTLSRLPISVRQRFIIERHWEKSEPDADVTLKGKIITRGIVLMIIATLATPLYAPGFSRLSNIGLVSLWFVLAILALAYLYSFWQTFYLFASEKGEQFLERQYVRRLLPRGVPATIWIFAMYGAFFGLTAALDHTFTAVAVALTCIAGLFMHEFVKGAVKKALSTAEEEVEHEFDDIAVVSGKGTREFVN